MREHGLLVCANVSFLCANLLQMYDELVLLIDDGDELSLT
jgi:hypothetical protein